MNEEKVVDLGRLSTFWKVVRTKINNKYTKPVNGIPKADLSAEVQDTLDSTDGKQSVIPDLDNIRDGAAKGATALQSFTETDPTVPSWAKQPSKPSYTAQEVGAIPDTTKVVTYTEEGSGTAPTLEYATKSDLATKVDKVSGKGLSTNDYTTAEKQKLAGLSSYDDTELRGLINGKYSKPSGGIPKSDLSSDVQATLNKVDELYDDYSTALNLI